MDPVWTSHGSVEVLKDGDSQKQLWVNIWAPYAEVRTALLQSVPGEEKAFQSAGHGRTAGPAGSDRV